MDEPLVRLAVGLVGALVLGQLVTGWFVDFIRKRWVTNRPEEHTEGVPAWLVGLLEQTFFVLVVAFNVSGAAIAMIGWVTVKMVPNWERYVRDKEKGGVEMAWTSMLGSMLSMLIALLGGLVARGAFW